jgi:hypothetical protein
VRIQSSWRSPWSVDRTASTDGEGRAPFPDLRPGTSLYVSAHHAAGSAPSQAVEVTVPGDAGIDVRLRAGRTLSGRVLDAATGAGVAGARVGFGWTAEHGTESAADGSYALAGWTGQGYRDLSATAPGYGRASVPVGAANEIDVRLERGDSVAGRVVDAQRRPVEGAYVWSVGSRHDGGTQTFCTRSGRAGADGRFLLGGLRRDLPHALVASAEGFGRRLVDFDPHPGGAGTVDLGDVVLSPERRVEGRVEDAAGSPVAGVLVTLTGWNADRAARRGDAGPATTTYGGERECVADDLGRFRFAGISSGEHALSAEPDGGEKVEASVTVGETDVLDVVLRAERASFVVELVDDSDRPIPRARAYLETPDGTLAALTDAQGVASFSPKSAPTEAGASVWGTYGGRRYLPPFWVDVAPGARSARVVATEGGLASGRVVDPAGPSRGSRSGRPATVRSAPRSPTRAGASRSWCRSAGPSTSRSAATSTRAARGAPRTSPGRSRASSPGPPACAWWRGRRRRRRSASG